MDELICDGEYEVLGPKGPAQAAILVRGAVKRYGNKKSGLIVLDGLNLTVIKGTIYGLLGASGCGKTTLLSCIVGRKRLLAGQIWVLGGAPGTVKSGVPGKRVGHMPQEMALYEELTICEMMRYFGLIYGMTMEKINERVEYLINFLDLPPSNRLTKDLSGGQMRRVSFATALIHQPELLILDEPTVGVDPVLRHRIWNHIESLVKMEHTTVLMTTHYIEEARKADSIGLMRSGVLLAEDNPENLMKKHKTQNIDDIFLILSLQQGPTKSETMLQKKEPELAATCKEEIKSDETDPKKKWYKCDACSRDQWMKIYALCLKNAITIFRDFGSITFIFILPVLQVVIFCLAIGGDPQALELGIVNEEVNQVPCDFNTGCEFANLSCRYLHYVSSHIIKIPHYTMDSAIQAVTTGESWGVMHFHKNFSIAISYRFAGMAQATDEMINASEILVQLDMTSQQISSALVHYLLRAYAEFVSNLFFECGVNPKKAKSPVTNIKPVYGSYDTTFTDFVAPGIIITAIFFMAVAVTSTTLISERIEGLYDRTLIAGVSNFQLIMSHCLTIFIIICIQTTLVLIFAINIFGVDSEGNIALLVIGTILPGFCGMGFGFVISAICDSEMGALQASLGAFYPILFLSGIIWPLEGMPTLMRDISQYLPLTMGITALRSIMGRGWGVDHHEVYFGYLSSFIWIVVFLLITGIILKLKRFFSS